MSSLKNSLKKRVISFRLSTKQEQQLIEIHRRDPAIGIKSSRQLARKIVLDFLNGRLAYKNPGDAMLDIEQYGTTKAA